MRNEKQRKASRNELLTEMRDTQRTTFKKLGLIFRRDDGDPLSKQRTFQIYKRTKELQEIEMADMADGWSDCGQIFYYSGKAFGVTEMGGELKTVYLGEADRIKKTLESKTLPDDATPIQREALLDILEYREEHKDDRRTAPTKRSPVRSRPSRDFKRREAHIRQTALKKTIPLRSPRRKK
jgi:hypothetical protein